MRRVFYTVLAIGWLSTAHAGTPPDALAPGVVQSSGPFEITTTTALKANLLCPPSGDAAVADAPLTHVRGALQPGDRLDILAIGSATVLGPDGTHPDGGFPVRMAEALKLAAPQTDVTISLRGGKGLTVEDTRVALSQAMATHDYQLILWQTGTVEAIRGLPAEALYTAIAAEAATLRDKSDLILIDPQFSRYLKAKTDITPYETMLERAASSPGVTLFHRFDLMQMWADHGSIDLEHAAPAERSATNEHLHACLGRALARMVLAGAGLHAAK